ncbi:MAG: DUF1512 family protein [Promethearchaeota archaeon]
MIMQNSGTDPISLIFSILFYVLFFISIFYGTKIQAYRSLRSLKSSLVKFEKWDKEVRKLTLNKFKLFCDEKLSEKDLTGIIDEFLNFVVISPTSLDPYGIIPKIEHIMDVREEKYINEVKRIALKADETNVHNLENLLEAAMAVNQIYRILLHYTLLGQKTKSYIILMQVEMQLSLLEGLAKAYVSAAKAFAEGSPIGDSLGPMVAASFVRECLNDISKQGEYEEIAYQTIMQQVDFEDRKIYIIRAKGPGGTVGKPGEGIKKMIESHSGKIKMVITIDAGLKLEGDKTGSIVMGVGAAIGGVGVEKSKIEDAGTNAKIPLYAIICYQSLEDAICTMKKSIVESVPKIIDKIKTLIRTQTDKGDSVILAAIGNTIGIGI